MKNLFSVTVYTLSHLFIPGMMALLIHLVILAITNARWYKIGGYILFCGLWITYAYFLARHNGMQKFMWYIALLGASIIGAGIYFLNKSSTPKEE